MPTFDSRLTLIISPLPSLPDPTASSLLPAFTLSGLHAQDRPVPHNVMEHPKGQLDSTHTCSLLENRQSIFRWWKHGWEETQCVRTSSEQQGCEPSSHTHNISYRWERRETSARWAQDHAGWLHTHVCAQSPSRVQLFWDLMDCCLPVSTVHGILQTTILEWVTISFSRGFSWPRDQTHISCISYSGRQIVYHWATWEALSHTCIWVQTLQYSYEISSEELSNFLQVSQPVTMEAGIHVQV